jgi:hypothetical protein
MNALAISCLSVVLAGGDNKLEILNAYGTYGPLGAKRTPGAGILPGDTAYFTFDIKNLKLDPTGRASYSIGVDVFDAKGDVLFQLKPQNAVAQNYFGGNVLQASSFLDIPLDAKPGPVSWKVTVHDRAADMKATLEGKGKILPPEFGIVQVATFADRAARVPMAPVGVVGSNLYIHFATVNFARDKKTKQPDVEVTLRVLDDKGKATFPNPLKGELNKDVPEDLKLVGMSFGLTMNRVGHFTAEIEARCKLCDKTVKVSLPVRILAAE